MNATVDKVITGQMRIAEVRQLSAGEAAANERAQRDAAAGVKPRKPRGPSKRVRELTDAAWKAGYDASEAEYRFGGMVGGVLMLLAGIALGGWIF